MLLTSFWPHVAILGQLGVMIAQNSSDFAAAREQMLPPGVTPQGLAACFCLSSATQQAIGGRLDYQAEGGGAPPPVDAAARDEMCANPTCAEYGLNLFKVGPACILNLPRPFLHRPAGPLRAPFYGFAELWLRRKWLRGVRGGPR